MRHIAVQPISVMSSNPYTASGFGDRIHTCLLAHQVGPATLHLTDWHVERPDKPASWEAIRELFPGTVEIQSHPYKPKSYPEWVQYLWCRGVHADPYHYQDSLKFFRNKEHLGFDASAHLRSSPRLRPPESPWRHPQKYVTVQWDAGGGTSCLKRISVSEQHRIEDAYRREGYAIVVVGGQATDKCLRSLPGAAVAVAHANLHAGTDSGLMHLASLYLDYSCLHIYTARIKSHHVRRWLANGAKENVKL